MSDTDEVAELRAKFVVLCAPTPDALSANLVKLKEQVSAASLHQHRMLGAAKHAARLCVERFVAEADLPEFLKVYRRARLAIFCGSAATEYPEVTRFYKPRPEHELAVNKVVRDWIYHYGEKIGVELIIPMQPRT